MSRETAGDEVRAELLEKEQTVDVTSEKKKAAKKKPKQTGDAAGKKTSKKKSAAAAAKKSTKGKKDALSAKAEKRKKRRRKTMWRVIRRCLLSLFTLLALAVFALYELLGVIFKGPSPTLGDMLTLSLMESSAGKFVPYLYYTDEEVETILARNTVVEIEDKTDTSLVVIEATQPPKENDEPVQTEDDIIVETIIGPTYRGWMMIVKDPSRVSVGVSADHFSDDRGGMRIGEIAEKYGAIAAINGGAFSDGGGQGNGGMPLGLTVSEGTIRNSSGSGRSNAISVGFTNENILVVGKFTKAEAEEIGLRDAVTFGPALIVNGEQAEVAGVSSGLNPRTAIGQRADGAVLMLVIDGRQVNSLGASMADLVTIMARYGAVNACNLDGGSSSNMYYNGEMLNDGVAVTGSRRIPTTFIVR